MQVINLEATISTPSLQVEMRTLRLGSGGTTNYNDLSNKPMIEGVTLQGNVPISDLGLRTSDLINDSGFITTGDIPTKTSDLTNDSDFQTGAEVAASITAAIPTNVSSFTNDVGYITSADIPTNVSAFTNDAGYLTSGDLPAFAVDSVNGQTGTVVLTGADIECGGAYHTNDAISTQIDAFTTDIANLTATMPTKTSDLQNDSGYITAIGAPVQSVNGQTGDVTLSIPTDTNDLTNGAGYITAAEAPVQSVNSQTGAVTITVPTDTTDLTNGAGYITAAEAPVQSVNGQTGAVTITVPTDTTTIEEVSNAIFQDGEYDKALDELIVYITPVQASGTPTPSDPLPITGWSNVEVSIKDNNDVLQFATTISLGQTVYGGVLNVTTGELTINNELVDLGSLNWGKATNTNNTYFYVLYSSGANGGYNTPASNIICSDYTTFSRNALTNTLGTIGIDPEPNAIYIADSQYDSYTTAQFAAAMVNVQLVVPLATPLTVTLTPTEVKSIIGYNKIYADSGDVKKLTYYKITTLGLYNWVKTKV